MRNHTYEDLFNAGKFSCPSPNHSCSNNLTFHFIEMSGVGRLKRAGSPQPAVRSMLRNVVGGTSFSMKKSLGNPSITIDPFSRLCQMHSGGNNVKVVGDQFSMQYILGLRAIAKDVFHEEISSISKAVYEEVVFRVSSREENKIQPYPGHGVTPDYTNIDQAISSGLEMQKANFIDPLYERFDKTEGFLCEYDLKIQKLEEAYDSMNKQEQSISERDSQISETRQEELETIHSELETIKNEFAERGNLYIKLCEELESDRLDNKMMKEELESEFNIIQQQFETFEKNMQDQANSQINENIDFFVESLKGDIKNLRTEVSHDREDVESLIKRKFDDIKKRIDADNEDFDHRLTKSIKDANTRYQVIVEKMEIETVELHSKFTKMDSKLEVCIMIS